MFVIHLQISFKLVFALRVVANTFSRPFCWVQPKQQTEYGQEQRTTLEPSSSAPHNKHPLKKVHIKTQSFDKTNLFKCHNNWEIKPHDEADSEIPTAITSQWANTLPRKKRCMPIPIHSGVKWNCNMRETKPPNECMDWKECTHEHRKSFLQPEIWTIWVPW